MFLNRLILLAVVVLCAYLAAAEELVSDIDNNEVLPENDVSARASAAVVEHCSG